MPVPLIIAIPPLVAYADVDCDDDNVCTVDVCDSYDGCKNIEHECLCEDYNDCTTEYCDPTQGCIYVTVSCDDGNSYTSDYCDSVAGCVHEEFEYETPDEGGY